MQLLTGPVPLLATVLLLAGLQPAHGQLRPVDPVEWRDLDAPSWHFSVGADVLSGQKASLAGTSGLLLDLAAIRAAWHLDRVVLSLSAPLLRVFYDEEVFATPTQGARPSDGGRRIDAGDVVLATLVELTPRTTAVQSALRFGVRLPTTDEAVGLERDQTDFFTSVAGRVRPAGWDISAQLGFAILGSRAGIDQTDPVLFMAQVARDSGSWSPILQLTGQHDTRENGDRRGTEDLGEVRAGLRVGTERWIQVMAVKGWADFSPDLGVSIRLGTWF